MTAQQLAGWLARMMISMFLIPEQNPDATAEAMKTIHRILAHPQREGAPAPEADLESTA